MNKYEIKLYYINNNNISDTPTSIYYIDRETLYGVEDHIKVMRYTNSNLKFKWRKL